MSTLKQIPLLKKPAPKPVAKPNVAATPAVVAAKPVPAVVQQAGPALPPNIAKKLTQLENELKAEKEKNVALQEKIAKKQEDKNAWRERIYPLADVEQWALARGDQPLPGDWRLEYHNK
jgi:hypothetical protein